MFSSVWNFLRRHRRKIAVSGFIVGGGIVATKLIMRKLRQWEEQEVMDCYEVLRKSQHFESTQKTCNQTVISLSSNLKSAIESLLDADTLINVLKTKPPNKLEIWEELKILSLARPLILMYSSSLLIILMKVQMNILGGYLYVEATHPEKSGGQILSQEMQQKFLTVVHYLLEDGLQDVVKALIPIIKDIAGPISLKTKFTILKVENLLKEIRNVFESSEWNPANHLVSYLMAKQEFPCDEPLMQQILNETSDVLGSEDCKNVFNSIVNSSFTLMVDFLTGFFIDNNNSQCFVNPQVVEIPFAKLIPFLCNSIHVQCSANASSLLHGLLRSEMISMFGANVYEAFCQINEKQK